MYDRIQILIGRRDAQAAIAAEYVLRGNFAQALAFANDMRDNDADLRDTRATWYELNGVAS